MTDSIISINHLTLTLKENNRKITDDLCYSVKHGDKVAIIGEEGDGKSTLLKYIYDPRLTSDYCSVQGAARVSGASGYLSQIDSLDEKSVSVCDFVGDDFYGAIDYADILRIPVSLLLSTRKLSTLSGGERIKIRLFKLLTRDPDVLLIDEPTNDLDGDALKALETFLIKTPKTVMFVSHDIALLERAATAIIHLEQVKRKTECRTVVASMGYADYIAARADNLSRQTQIALKEREEFDAKLKRWQHIRDRVDYEQKTISRGDPHGARLLKKKMKTVIAQRRRFERERENLHEIPDSEDAIVTRFPDDVALPKGKTVLDLSLSPLIAGDSVLAETVKLKVMGNDKIAIIGANGAGKTTLLKAIKNALAQRNDLRVAYMPQDYSEELRFGTPLDYLGAIDKVDLTYARQLLGNLRFTPAEMLSDVTDLSGGQQAKLIFLRAVLGKCNILLLDEPTRNLSPLSVPSICQALRGFKGCIISVSHDRTFIDSVCDTVYELSKNGLTLRRNGFCIDL